MGFSAWDNTAMQASDLFTYAFVALLLAGLGLKLFLASRQVRHIAQHRAQVPVAFAERISLAAHQKAADYTVAKTRWTIVELAFGAAVLIGWTLMGGLSALDAALLQWLGAGMTQQLALLAAFALIGGVLDLPFDLYKTFVIEARFGFNKSTLGLWLGDLLKGALVGALIGLPIAWAVLWFMGSTGSLWWLYAWVMWMGFNLLLLLIYPTFIAPLFNKFQPLADDSLKARVSALMQRCGFHAKELLVMDGSRRSAHANAYFTGFGASKRVVFFDTLLSKLSPEEIEAVLAHELGHFKHKHVIKRIVTMFAISLAGFALLGWLVSQVWFYTGLGVQPHFMGSNHALALLLFMLAMPVFSFFITPVSSHFSRKQEFEADAYAISQAQAKDLVSALLKLYEDNASTLTPDPLFVQFYYSHPPASERIARMQTA
jgi:STE24 endopeptidase